MQKTTNYLLMLLAIAAIAIGSSSCSKIDEWTADPNDVKSVNAVYSVELSQTWYDYFDIEVTYYDEYAHPQTVQIYSRWEYSFSLPPKKAPHNYALTVKATLKEDHPGLDNVVPITFSQNIKAEFFGLRYDGSIHQNLVQDLNPHTQTDTGIRTFTYESDFKSFINRGRITIFNFTNSWDGTY